MHSQERLSPEASPDLDSLGYFVGWGGRSWRGLLATALDDFAGRDLRGKRVLEVGAGPGRLSCLFGLLGANVTGIDVNSKSLPIARAEARKWNVSDRVEFRAYDGDLDILPDESFDIVVTKSVLVVIPDLPIFLTKLAKKMRPGGKGIFLENGRGNVVLHTLRRLRHRRWDNTANYFTEEHVELLRRAFDVKLVRRVTFPPAYLVCVVRP